MNQLDTNFVIYCYNRYCRTLQFDTSLGDVDCNSRSLGCEKVKTSVVTKVLTNWMEFGLLLRLFRLMNLIILFYFV